MSLQEFWGSVRRAASGLRVINIADTPRFDAASIERALGEKTDWLSKKALIEFSEADFAFLPEEQRKTLAQRVAAFRKIASPMSRMSVATAEQIEQALPLYRDIVTILEFDRYEDADAFRLGKQIEQELQDERPAELVDLRFRTGPDHAGDPGIWIWGFLADEEDEAFLNRADLVHPLLSAVSREVAPDHFPYIRFRSVADQTGRTRSPKSRAKRKRARRWSTG